MLYSIMLTKRKFSTSGILAGRGKNSAWMKEVRSRETILEQVWEQIKCELSEPGTVSMKGKYYRKGQ